jgi:hypothetical protein
VRILLAPLTLLRWIAVLLAALVWIVVVPIVDLLVGAASGIAGLVRRVARYSSSAGP